MDLEKINDSMIELIERKADITNGIELIMDEIENNFEHYNAERVKKLSWEKSYLEFSTWMDKLLEEEPIPEITMGINFGLFLTDDGVQLYISGSNTWDKNDYNWATTNDYLPKGRYPVLKIFRTEIEKIWKYEDEEVAVFLSLATAACYVYSYVTKNISKILRENPFLYISVGFDGKDLHNIGKLTNDGLEDIF